MTPFEIGLFPWGRQVPPEASPAASPEASNGYLSLMDK